MGATRVVVFEGEGCLLAEEGAAHAQTVDAEMSLPEDPSLVVHAQTVAVEPDKNLGEPETIEEVACTQVISVEPDLLWEEIADRTWTLMRISYALSQRLGWARGRVGCMRRRRPLGRLIVSRRTSIFTSSCKNPRSATLPCKRKPDHSPCRCCHHPPSRRLLGRRARRPST